MNLLPKSLDDFSSKSYWDAFFQKRGKKAFEWYGEYPELAVYLHKYIKQQDDVLIIGCGNSTIGRDLYDVGYSKITNIDISPVVIKQMQSQCSKTRPSLKYIQMDALNTTFTDESFNVAIDKATIDALIPDESSEAVSNANKYFKEICRLLKSGGRYICITLLQEHILKLLLTFFPENNFMVRVLRCFEAENKNAESISMPIFVVVCTKCKIVLPAVVLEIALTADNKVKRMKSVEEVQMQVANVQRTAFITAGLKRTFMTDGAEVSFELFKDSDKNPRYTVFVVDIPRHHKNFEYAAFIAPHGREHDWLFCTAEGRKHLVEESKHNRLAIFTMHAGHKYDDFEGVQNELADVVLNFAPNGYNKKILFLSLGSNIGKRTIRHQGSSHLSGEYIIEDIETDSGEKFRRLYYTKTQNVTQSEAKLKLLTKNGTTKELIDFTYLSCNHHKIMSTVVKIATQDKQKSSVLVIGLGGGGLCTFMRKFLPKTHITAVDVDPDMLEVAKNWFGLKPDEMLSVKIIDGIKFLQDVAIKGEQFDAILFDVDNKDTSIGMSCPPKEFLEPDVLKNVRKLLHQNGLFILNLVLRNKALKPKIMEDLEVNFKLLKNCDVEDELNEIIICGTNDVRRSEEFEKKYDNALASMTAFLQKHNK